jgi:hypothetical protein
VIERLPLKELLNKTGVRAVPDQMVAEAKLPRQPSKFALLSEPTPAGEVVEFPGRRKATETRP